MYVTNITDYNTTIDYDNITSSNNTTLSNCTDSEFKIDITIPTLLLTIPWGLSFLCLISFMDIPYSNLYSILNEYREVFIPAASCSLYYNQTKQRWNISIFNKVNLNIINNYDKINIYSPSLHQNLYQKLIKCFSNYIPLHIVPNIVIDEDIDVVIDELVNKKVFEKSDTEIETYESIEELKYPQEYEDGGINILDVLNDEEMNDPLVQAMSKRSKHNNLSISIFSQE